MTTNYANTSTTYNFWNYSVTPQLNDLLARGAIYQQDLMQRGNPIVLAQYLDATTVAAPLTFDNYIAANETGSVLRQIQGADGFRYTLARFDGILVSPDATPSANSYYYPNQGTAGNNAYSNSLKQIGFNLVINSSSSPTTYTYNFISSATTVSGVNAVTVYLSDNVNDTYQINASGQKYNSFGGFTYAASDPVANAKNPYSNKLWSFVAPADFVNGNPLLPSYSKQIVNVASKTVTYNYVITVGDYVWLKLNNSGNTSSPREENKIKTK